MKKHIEEDELEQKVPEPYLYILLNKSLEASQNTLLMNTAMAISAFHRFMIDFKNENMVPDEDNTIVGLISHRKERVENYENWLMNPKYKFLYLTPEEKEDLVSICLNDESGEPIVDDYTCEEYKFSVENREIAKLLIKSNEDFKVIGEKDGRVWLSRPENVASFIFTEECKKVIDKYVSEHSQIEVIE